jgi:hypothetical protein
MRTRALVVTAGLLALAGCASAGGAVGAAPASGPSVRAKATSYLLYTHCGIDDARINGGWYQARPPLSDGSGNPPAGWGNPYQQGTIRITSGREAEFSDSAGHHVRFVLRPGATGPKQLCS